MDHQEALFEILYARRSVRKFRENPVEQEKITRMLEAAMAAPSACNLQPWEFVVVTEHQAVGDLKQCIGEYNGRHYNAPAGILICANRCYIPPEWGSDGVFDCAAAVENLLLAAHAMGLGAVWIGDLDREEARRRFDVPGHVAVHCAVLLGYPDEEKQPRTQYKEEAVYWQRYDSDRPHDDRSIDLRFT
jgi:nitroreductase